MTTNVTVGPDPRIFAYFALLNRYGYDLEGNPEMHPIRTAVRDVLSKKILPSDQVFQTFCHEAKPFWPNVFIGEVYLLHLDGPPSLSGPSVYELSAFYRAVEYELPIGMAAHHFEWLSQLPLTLSAFWNEADLDELWQEYRPRHESDTGAMKQAVAEIFAKAQTCFGIEKWPFQEVRIIVNYLQSDWLADQLVIKNKLIAILGSAKPDQAHSALHEALHLVIRPILQQYPDLVKHSLGAGLALKDQMQEQGYWGTTDEHGWYRALQEELVRTFTIWVEDGATANGLRRCKWHAERGFAHMPLIWETLTEMKQAHLDKELLEVICERIAESVQE